MQKYAYAVRQTLLYTYVVFRFQSNDTLSLNVTRRL